MDARFIAGMEDVLDHYERGRGPGNPPLCFDERPCQFIGDVLVPVPASPGRERREDHHYRRNGTCVVLLAVEPGTGRRTVEVSERKTKKDYARFLKKIAGEYRNAKRTALVQDNLNTHDASSFYESFPPGEAFKLMRKFEMVFTPGRASWLNMAEIEFSALSKQCLDRRIGSLAAMVEEVGAWTRKRNEAGTRIDWQFTKERARAKFKRRYRDIKN